MSAEQNIPLLTISELNKKFGERVVIKNLSLDVKRGEVVVCNRPLGVRQKHAFEMH